MPPSDIPAHERAGARDHNVPAPGRNLLEPCNFMPQPSTPTSFIFARQRQAENNIMINYGHYEEHAHDGDADDSGYDTVSWSDTTTITPVTPSSVASFSSRISLNLFDHLSGKTAPMVTFGIHAFLITATSVALLIASSLWLGAEEHMERFSVEIGMLLWWIIQTVSEALEVGLDCAGFVVGRAAARFGGGFARGYRL